MIIETERLRLRDWDDADIVPFARHTNVEPVMHWLGGVRTDADMIELIGRLGRWQQERGFTFWAVERKADDELLGFCGLKIADGAGSPVEGDYEIGWRLREDAWGQGYAREAAEATLDFAFAKLAAPHVVALTFPQNMASWGLMVRLGMERREDLDYDDPRFPDLNPVIVYAIEAESWRR